MISFLRERKSYRYPLTIGLMTFVLTVVSVSGLSPNAFAGPILITDNRVEWFTGKPSIGRGFSFETNTMHSMCFDKIDVPDATFDFDYVFVDVDDTYLKNMFANPLSDVEGSITREFLRPHLEHARQSEKQDGTKLHTVLVKLVVDEYNQSLSEGTAGLTDSAKQLLKNKNYQGFFNACGFYYIRSLERFSAFYAIMQYETSDDEVSDRKFRLRLERELLRFEAELKPLTGTSKEDVKLNTELEKARAAALAAEENFIAKLRSEEREFSEQLEQRSLRIDVQAVGLGSGKLHDLIPTSIAQFRKALRSAAALMNNETSGIVKSVEVAPWIDHPQIDLLFKTVGHNGIDSFRELNYLEVNSQVLASIAKKREGYYQAWYKTNLCQRELFENFPTYTTNFVSKKSHYFDPDNTLFRNSLAPENPALYLSLRDFKQYFIQNPSWKILEEADLYVHGTAKEEGAIHCIEAMVAKGLQKVEFGTIPSCVQALRPHEHNSHFVKEYCLPKPARTEFIRAGEDAGQSGQIVQPSFRFNPNRDLTAADRRYYQGVQLELLHSGDKESWLIAMVNEFERENPDIEVKLVKQGGMNAIEGIASGDYKPTLWSASGRFAFDMVNQRRSKLGKSKLFKDAGPSEPRYLALSPLVLVTWGDRGKVLENVAPAGFQFGNSDSSSARSGNGTDMSFDGKDEDSSDSKLNPEDKLIDLASLSQAVLGEKSWVDLGGDESWGKVKLGVADPIHSSVGIYLLMLMAAAESPDLNKTLDKVTDETITSVANALSALWLDIGNERTIEDGSHTILKETVLFGSAKYDIALVPEHLAIQMLEKAKDRWEQDIYVYYLLPSAIATHPIAIPDGDWVSEDQRKAGVQFMKFLRGRKAQESALEFGFRPSDVTIDLTDDKKKTSFDKAKSVGIRTRLPSYLVDPDIDVLRKLLERWRSTQRK